MFMREYSDTAVKANQCVQKLDDVSTAAYNATDLTKNMKAVSSL